ncbi:MAG TPA: hypothetical protein VN495_00150 [Candidatus Paceibacterota bacterium]|nr:hypothetical protein [Candidatus Paceibacterota bacterium]
MTKLDEIALNIELVLISIIEAVALTFLGDNASHVLHSSEWPLFVPYVLAGLTILLVFWSQAILHAVSFIRWPLSMEHMLLYFVAVFLQILAYGSIDSVQMWFFWWSLFSILALLIYVVDLHIIRRARSKFEHHQHGVAYIADVERRHVNELRYLVPIALAFNIGAALFAWYLPTALENPSVFIALGLLQFLISLGALIDCVRNFRARSKILPTLFA